jgi:hypothetical protein
MDKIDLKGFYLKRTCAVSDIETSLTNLVIAKDSSCAVLEILPELSKARNFVHVGYIDKTLKEKNYLFDENFIRF